MVILVLVLSFGISALVRWWMTRTYARWSTQENSAGVDGERAARLILDANGLQNVQLEQSPGKLSDHYIPSKKLIRLSATINDQPSIASVAVAAHEVGHALQDKEGYAPLKLKAVLMPAAAIGNQFGLLLAIGGSFVGSSVISNIGLLMILGGLLMPLLTLPIEFDASKRALQQLTALKLVDQRDYAGAKSMLRAAALTYVAGAASSLAILGLVMLRFIRR